MAATRTRKPLTDAELLLLGLVAEMPRHGYELEREIERRGMREWTRIGFSSVYFVLGKLEKAGLVSSAKPRAAKARKTFTLTDAGQEALAETTREALAGYQPTYPSLHLGLLHWPVLRHAEAVDALQTRGQAVADERARLAAIQVERQPLPDYVEALFDHSLSQLDAEAAWIERTVAYMQTKPLLDEDDP